MPRTAKKKESFARTIAALMFRLGLHMYPGQITPTSLSLRGTTIEKVYGFEFTFDKRRVGRYELSMEVKPPQLRILRAFGQSAQTRRHPPVSLSVGSSMLREELD
ncbi:hypothetical protein PoB_002773300 [Plakobranchus ocellatus]|uniref:Uncharacterized protein n=1 Tax=Plakobranchus ocellatus TaxID=259542 RepID=A0AAV4A3J8_9GAST|nr:hypothetical protein PoB_002773300 [Plakobranchus ocellatus]